MAIRTRPRSNLRYGFDNWIWGTVGLLWIRGTVAGRRFGSGKAFTVLSPDGSRWSLFVRAIQHLGPGITEDNIIFGSTANGNASMYMSHPESLL